MTDQPPAQEARDEDRYRVAITENAKGDVQVSTRATHDDPEEATKIAVQMWFRTKESLPGGVG